MGTPEYLAQQVADLLTIQPRGLCSDFDGTLSRIVPSPDEARIEPAIRDALARLARHLDVLAIVTGRSVDDVRWRVGLSEVVYIGNHGLERWERGEHLVEPQALTYVPHLANVARALADRVQLPGIEIELKRLSLSVHYRRALEPEAAARQIGPILEALASEYHLRLVRGRMVFELRPPIDRDKGSAVAELVMRYGLRAVVFLGDDRTDLDAMRHLAQLREQGRIQALNIGVHSEEAPPELTTIADVLLDGVDGVASLLDRVERLLAR